MSHIAELLSGVMRYFPNMMAVTLFVLGVTTGRITWILVAIGSVIVIIATLTLQYLVSRLTNVKPLSGAAIMEACSLLPISGSDYAAVPSLWVALSAFFATYIFVNANNIYTVNPTRVHKDKLAVQQRKGMGLISMIAIILLFVLIMFPRWRTTCETTIGVILGLVIGCAGGYGWWAILNACGSNVFPDIHGIMLGLAPGKLHTNPRVCTPTQQPTQK